VWSSDGRELFYRHDDQMMAVSVAAQPEFSAGRPHRVFEFHFDAGDNGPNYDVSRDGKYFIIPKSDQAPAASELHLVLNWFAEVASRAPSTRARHSSDAPSGLAALWRLAMPTLLAAAQQSAQTNAAEAGVRETLQRYSAALESLDATAVKKVQPSLPEETLARAFKDMRELKVAIDDVKVLSIDGTTARVSCRVMQTLTPKTGSKRTTAVTRVMRLKRGAEAWFIDGFER